MDQEVDDFIKDKAFTEMNKEHDHFGGACQMFLMSDIYRMQKIGLKNDLKGLILETDSDKLHPFHGFGDP